MAILSVDALALDCRWARCGFTTANRSGLRLNRERVVLGLLRREQLDASRDDEPVERVMLPGPSTFRPDVDIRKMAHSMGEHDRPSVPVTNSDGRLVGMLMREDAERAAHGSHADASTSPNEP